MDIERFCTLVARLAALPGQGRQLREYTGRSSLPQRGVYFFCESGERRAQDPRSHRIVRVGTHAISANSRSTLWCRLRTHRGTRDGGGNHRASIFRLHVGNALLMRDGEVLASWGQRDTAAHAVRASEAGHERRVSEHIGCMRIYWVDVPDEAGPQSLRAYIERNAIALLSNRLNPIDPPEPSWLGLHSTRVEIRRTGLWNLKHVNEVYHPRFLDVLEHTIDGMLGS